MLTTYQGKCRYVGLELQKNSTKKKKLFGGIVTNTDQREYTGSWIIYKGKGRNIKSTDFSNWGMLEL